MRKVFVDTNLFIRYLTNDVPKQIDKVEDLFDQAERGQLKLVTGPPVFFEIAWTLKSFYKLDRRTIYECLTGILGLPGLEISDIDILEEALELFNNTSADFSDAYICVAAQRCEADAVATFNVKHFKDLPTKLFPLE